MTGQTRGGRRMRTVDEVSAGGLVLDRLDQNARGALLGKRNARGALVWSLPKGHMEPGEDLQQTAVREVAEETGVHGRVLAPLGDVDYWFVLEGTRIHKRVHFFLMVAEGGSLGSDDIEVTELAWVPVSELPERLSYAGERRLARAVPELLAGAA